MPRPRRGLCFNGKQGPRGIETLLALHLPFPPTPDNAPRLAAMAVEAAMEVDGIALDYSPDSLPKVEKILRRLHGEGVDEALLAFGCYVGEVFVRAGAGRWRATAETPMRELAEVPLLVQLGRGDYCNPLGRVRKCYDGDPAGGLAEFWEAFVPGTAGGKETHRPWWRRWFGR